MKMADDDFPSLMIFEVACGVKLKRVLIALGFGEIWIRFHIFVLVKF
jgi:hypothetical protein